jgi:molybdate transport system ATP-binding protein
VTVEYDAQVGARDVDLGFEVAEGETVALLGPNGAGKSTALQVLSGLLRPDRGRVVLDGRVLAEVGSRRSTYVPPHDRRIATLAQEPLLFPHLSVLDNVAFGPRSAGAGRREAREVGRAWLDDVGVGDLAERRPAQLSGGQAQRAAVARALAAEPRLLLLDEPMAALDVAVTPALRQTLRRVLADRTAIIVTHDALDALLLADRVLVLEDGRVVEEGPSADVLARPRSAFAARIAGLNMLRGTWRDGAVLTSAGRHVAGETGEGLTPRDGDPVVAVFSPTAVSVFRAAPGGSPRNAFEVVVTDLEPQHGHVRVRADELAADITPQAAAELDLAPGTPAWFAVKATEVSVYPT